MENERIIRDRQVKAFTMLAIGLIAGLVMFFVSVVDAFAVPQAASTGWAARRQGGSIQSRVTTVETRRPRLAYRVSFQNNNPAGRQNTLRVRTQLLSDAGTSSFKLGFRQIFQHGAPTTHQWNTRGTLPTQNRGTGWRACATTQAYNGSNQSAALRALIRFP